MKNGDYESPILEPINDNANDVSMKISAGSATSFVIRDDSSLWAWGYNRLHMLGFDTADDMIIEPVKIMDDMIAVSSGFGHAVAIKDNSSLWAWGRNELSQLGDGTMIDRITPIKIMDDVAAVSVGTTHTMAIKTDGSLWGWGTILEPGGREIRPLELIPRFFESSTPVKIMDDVVAVSAGATYTMAIKTDGSLWAWGIVLLDSLRVPYPKLLDTSTPTKIMEDVAAVSCGKNVAIIIKSDGSLWTWGVDWQGLLGNGTESIHETPVKIMDNAIAVSAKYEHAAAIKTDGSLWVWGLISKYNTSEFFFNSPTPTKIMDDVTAVSVGVNHTIITKTDGSIWAWGGNESGQLGDGTTEDRFSPECIMD